MEIENFAEMQAIYPMLDESDIKTQIEEQWGGPLPQDASVSFRMGGGYLRIDVALKHPLDKNSLKGVRYNFL